MGNFLDVFEELEELEELGFYTHGASEVFTQGILEVFTNEEARPDSNWIWFYRIMSSENKRIDGGEFNLCNCAECIEFGKDVFEYFSIYTALTWIKSNHSDVSINLWVSSEKFLYDSSENLLGLYGEMYRCAFIKTLGKDLSRLLSKLDVEIFQYCYANNEIIPVFF